jgi:hypothetical protein
VRDNATPLGSEILIFRYLCLSPFICDEVSWRAV